MRATLKSVFPVLFLALLPIMMPKAVDKTRVHQFQRIPTMPPVMDNLTPKMMPELIPAVS